MSNDNTKALSFKVITFSIVINQRPSRKETRSKPQQLSFLSMKYCLLSTSCVYVRIF